MFYEKVSILDTFSIPSRKLPDFKDLGIKNQQKTAFFKYLKRELPENVHSERKAPMLWRMKSHKLSQTRPWSFRLKMKCSNNFKSEAPRLLHKIIEQTREIAFWCFFLWELPARKPRRQCFKREAPRKNDRGTQRKLTNTTFFRFSSLVADRALCLV